MERKIKYLRPKNNPSIIYKVVREERDIYVNDKKEDVLLYIEKVKGTSKDQLHGSTYYVRPSEIGKEWLVSEGL